MVPLAKPAFNCGTEVNTFEMIIHLAYVSSSFSYANRKRAIAWLSELYEVF